MVDYQNRLHTRDYLKMFLDAGFSIIELHEVDGDAGDYVNYHKIKKADCFKYYSDDELIKNGATFVLRKDKS